MEASIKIQLEKERFKTYKDVDFAELCITSSAQIEQSGNNQISVDASKAKGTKCPVCWKISVKPCLRHGT